MMELIAKLIIFLLILILLYVLLKLIFEQLESSVNLRLFKRFYVKKHQKGILYREGDFEKILLPGVYWYFDPLNKLETGFYDLNQPLFDLPIIDFLIEKKPELIETHFEMVDLSDNEAALIYQEDKLVNILPPSSRKLFWKDIIETKIEKINIDKDFEIPEKLMYIVPYSPELEQKACIYRIADHEKGLLFINGQYSKILEPGTHGFWNFNHLFECKIIDLRIQPVEINGQEIITKDKVTMRANLSANYRVNDPVKAIKELKDYKDYIYVTLQHALREAMGTHTMDELLSLKDEINKMVYESSVNKLNEYGIELKDVGIKDYILPGDMRDIMNQVVAADKLAQANLIQRREETAATRSLLNTAKLMENNPVLLRLKELEALEKITSKIDNITVYGGLEGLLKELISFKPKKEKKTDE